MDMIERVARAVRHKRGLYGRPTPSSLSDARAAIEAMREPTDAMLGIDAPDMPAGGDVGEIWRDMIDAALNPSQT